MELKDVIEKRRSIRNYRYDTISEEKITKILESARLCQSAKNRQPWRFIVFDTIKKQEIANLMQNNSNAIKLDGYSNSSKGSANAIRKCSVLILVLKEKDDNWNAGDLLSIGAAIEHMCLTAVDMGLGSLWIRDVIYAQDEILKYINHTDLELISGIAIGYPAEDPAPRPRKKLEELLLK